MPKVSVIIPFFNDGYLIEETVRRLVVDIDPRDIEVLVIDDGSTYGPPATLREYPNVRVINTGANKGVGHAFDYGALRSDSEVLLLMGSDIRVKERSWLTDVLRIAHEQEDCITAAACQGISEDDDELKEGDKTTRYAADILMRVSKEDLPKSSPIQQRDQYADILQCKWLPKANRLNYGSEAYEVPAVFGASYVTTKEWYFHIGGWGSLKSLDGLSKEEQKWSNHKIWGGLEPMISLKTWFMGGKCLVDPSWSTGHIFGRGKHVMKTRGWKGDKYYFNKLFMAYTLFTDKQAKVLDSHLLTMAQENVARHYIKKNWNAILLEKEYIDKRREADIYLFEEKFGYDIEFLK